MHLPLKSSRSIEVAASDRIFYALIGLFLGAFMLSVLLPLIFVVSASFSAPEDVVGGRVFLWPVNPTLEGYGKIFENRLIGTAYFNTFFYTVTGTAVNLAMTLIAAYPLARRQLPYKGVAMFLFTFTMLFNGGIIPNYMLMLRLNLINSRWAMILPGAISVYNLIIARTFIQNIPAELEEAAGIDGASDVQIFLAIILPLSTTLLSVLTLYYAVAHWNAYFDAFLYLTGRSLYPLQIILREILITNSISATDIVDEETLAARQGMADLIKYSLIIVSTLPVLVLYPFVKKYFLKGVMIGALKG